MASDAMRFPASLLPHFYWLLQDKNKFSFPGEIWESPGTQPKR
jgi:hypothetical protein